MEPGAMFEKLIYLEFFNAGIFINRIKTRITQFKGDNEIADFYVYDNRNLIYLEAKTTKAKAFPFDMIQPNQAVGLNGVRKYTGIYGGILLEMREFDRYFYIPIEVIDAFIRKGKVSMNLNDLEDNALEIEYDKEFKLTDIGKRIEQISKPTEGDKPWSR